MIFRSLLCMLLSGFFSSVGIAAEILQTEIRAEQWEIPRQGERLLRQSALNEIINHWLQQPDSMIEIRYPGGEEGEIWVNELMDWLVSLGIPSRFMRPVPGSGAEDRIQLVVITAGL